MWQNGHPVNTTLPLLPLQHPWMCIHCQIVYYLFCFDAPIQCTLYAVPCDDPVEHVRQHAPNLHKQCKNVQLEGRGGVCIQLVVCLQNDETGGRDRLCTTQ